MAPSIFNFLLFLIFYFQRSLRVKSVLIVGKFLFFCIRRRTESATDCSEESESCHSSAGSRHKVVVMGAAKVGKTSLISQFLYGTFTEKYKRTIEEMHHADFNVSGVPLTLDILDTSGSYEFPAMRALSISSADAFILVYSVVDATTFEEVRVIRDQIIETKGTTEVPIVVVGNKFDLANDKRQVSRRLSICR